MRSDSEFRYDAIITLGAVLGWSRELGFHFETWLPPERYRGLLVMGQERAIATLLTHRAAPIILVTGGSDTHPETRVKVSRSDLLADLIIRLGVFREKVISVGSMNRGSILGNLDDVVDYLRAHSWILKSRKIGIVVPSFQLARAEAMFGCDDFFSQQGIEISWLVVETILGQLPENREMIKRIYSDSRIEVALAGEAKGLADWWAGKYKSKVG